MMARIATADRIASTKTKSIIYNGNFEIKPSVITAQTNVAGRWIDGTAAGSVAKMSRYGWAAPSTGSGVGANGDMGFDTTIFRSGTASMRLSNLTASGGVTAMINRNLTPAANVHAEFLRLVPNTSYTITGYVRTNNVPTNGAFLDVRQFNAAFSTIITTSTNKLSGTDTSWRELTATFTSDASVVWASVFLRNAVTGNISDAWFDDLTLIPNTSTGRVSNA